MLESLGKAKKAEKPIWSRNITARQKALGIQSIELLAEMADLPYPTVRDIASGVSEGGYDKREKIAAALRWTVSDLYTDTRNPKLVPDVSFAAEILSRFAVLPHVLQQIALTVIYQDKSYLREIPAEVGREMAAEIARLFEPLQKAGRK